jgi:uncharacterized protein (TIGR02145 family)
MKRVTNRVVLVCLLFGLITFFSCNDKEVTLPILTTSSPTNITINSVTGGGDITKNGGADITDRGVCWATSRNPVITGSHASDGKGTGSFDVNITGLVPNTMYYIRAYATNSAGTAYGNEVSFTTTSLVVPVLTTTAVSSVSQTTAVSGGIISSDGGASVSERGICWSATGNPTTEDHKTSEGTGTGSFSTTLSGLSAGTTYHIRAYAINSVGTGYGNDIQFTTQTLSVPVLTTVEVTSITLTSATSGGNVTSDGGSDVTVRGICWAKTSNPTTASSNITSGNGTGIFTGSMEGLEPETTYHVRSYATNNTGTGYGNDISFTTLPIGIATLTTNTISDIGLTTAVSGGVITSNGGGAISVKGVCWSTSANPNTDNFKTSNGGGSGEFTSSITGLLPATVYHVRAYATNNAGTAYGEDQQFTTLAIGMASLSTTQISGLTMTSAISGGIITSDGGANVTARGVCWSTTGSPTTDNDKTVNGSGTGAFTSNISGLLPNTNYHLRAYAINSAGTAYGNEVTFTTSSSTAPVLGTAAVSAITLTTASSGGTITSDGGAQITEKGVCWSTSPTPTIGGARSSDGSGSGNFTSNITGLQPGTIYHVRAYATNSVGTSYGNDVQFTTVGIAVPSIATAVISSITTTTAISGGNITSNGGATITTSGICWSTNQNPTTDDSRTTDGTASGSFASTMTGLAMGTTYYVRAYATNSAGTAYGNQISFGTKVTDIEGNIYGVVTIGTQVWMTENLRTATLNNTNPIPNVMNNTAWAGLTSMAYSWYNNDISNKPVYGAIYNWFAVNTGNLCPVGWHVPTETEFGVLEAYLGMSQADINGSWDWRGTDQGTQLKNTSGWLPGLNGTNTSGFTGLPGGYRYGVDGTFNNLQDLAYWWSSTELDAATAWYRRVDGNQTGIYKAAVLKQGGKFVRCLKN